MFTKTYIATIRDGLSTIEIHSDRQPSVGPAGELRLVGRDGRTWIYAPGAWVSYSYDTPDHQA